MLINVQVLLGKNQADAGSVIFELTEIRIQYGTFQDLNNVIKGPDVDRNGVAYPCYRAVIERVVGNGPFLKITSYN